MHINQRGFSPIMHLFFGVAAGAFLLGLFLILNRPLEKNLVSSVPNTQISPKNETASPSATLDQAKLQKYLTVEAALLGTSDNFSLYFKDLSTDKEVTIDPTRSWIPASTIKAYVVLETFRQRDLGLINFNNQIDISADNVVPTELETDDYPRLRVGTRATVQQLLEAMITQSDNTAYNSLLDLLDRRNINNSLRNIGLTETVVGEKLNLDDGQFQKDLTVPGRQPNTTTAKDLATFFDLLYVKQIPDSDEMLAIFKKQKINNMIPALLPSETIVAHKTGDWAPIFHDGGVIYKTQQPFILAIFTNSNSPSTLSQLAKVAYYQNAQVVGQDIIPTKKSSAANYPRVYLTEEAVAENVLAAENSPKDQKFPEVTAEDLGITTNDLSLYDAQDAKKISGAIIVPGSILYEAKLFVENLKYNLPFAKVTPIKKDLDQSSSRLSELKTALKSGNLEGSRKLLGESEKNLKQAVSDAKKGSSTDIDLTDTKQINELHYATLAEAAKSIDPQQKEQFVDMTYNFLQENKKDVQPVIAKSVIANPLQQKPLIGTIKEMTSEKTVVEFDDGSQKSLTINNTTPVRDFHSDQIDTSNHLAVGSKLAIVGQTTPDNKIIPQFILKNIPRELPDKHEGTVLEVDPKDRILKIKESNNQTQTVQVDEKTIVKGTNTDVSLEGIKAGSNVTVFGEYQNNPQLATASANPTTPAKPVPTASGAAPSTTTPKGTTLPKPLPSGTSGPRPAGTNKPAPTAAPGSNNSQQIIKATSISVTKNSSGKDEKTDNKSSGTQKTPPPPPSNQKPSVQPPPPPSNQQTPQPTKK